MKASKLLFHTPRIPRKLKKKYKKKYGYKIVMNIDKYLNKALTIPDVVRRSEQLHVENACKCEDKKGFNRLQCPNCKPL